MTLIPAHYRILAIVLLALACAGSGYVLGVSREADRRDAVALRGLGAGIVVADRESTRREALGALREESREQIRVVYRTIREKAHEIESKGGNDFDCGLDADGLQLWNAANAGAAAPVPGEPDYGLPTASAGAFGRAARSVGQPYRGDGALRAMPGPDEQANGVR